MFALIVVAVLFGPHLHAVDPQYLDLGARNQGVSFAHPMGTDNLGRDMFAQMLAGGRVSLAVGFTAMLLALVLGTFVGVLAGYFNRLDGPLMRLTDLFLALPLLPLLLVIIMLFRDTLRAAFGPESGIFLLIVFVIGVTSWMQTARIVRGEVLVVREREFVTAARSVGVRERRIITRHVLPNVLSPIMVSAPWESPTRSSPNPRCRSSASVSRRTFPLGAVCCSMASTSSRSPRRASSGRGSRSRSPC